MAAGILVNIGSLDLVIYCSLLSKFACTSADQLKCGAKRQISFRYLEKINLKMSSAKWQYSVVFFLFFSGFSVLIWSPINMEGAFLVLRCVYISLSLTHWGRATHICVSKLTSIASDNGLSPGRRQAIIWNHAGILSIGLLGTNFSEILIEILTFSFKKMRLKVSSASWCPFCLGLNVLIT